MSSEKIKSGSQVVSDFLKSLQDSSDMDPDTLASVRTLFKEGKLTKTRLIGSLEALRTTAIAQRANSASHNDNDGDDQAAQT